MMVRQKVGRKESDRRYRESHREQISLSDKAYKQAHREERRVSDKFYWQAHREEKRVYNRAYYQAHINEIRLNVATWQKTHPEMIRAREFRRRARKACVPCTATAEHEIAIKAAYRGRCAYCGTKPVRLTIDHVIPLARGGTHTPENLVPACGSCNFAKGDREAPSVPSVRLLM